MLKLIRNLHNIDAVNEPFRSNNRYDRESRRIDNWSSRARIEFENKLIVANALIAWIRILSRYIYSSPLSRLSFEHRWYLTVTSKLTKFRRLFDFEMLDPDAAWCPRVLVSLVVSECGRMRVLTNPESTYIGLLSVFRKFMRFRS